MKCMIGERASILKNYGYIAGVLALLGVGVGIDIRFVASSSLLSGIKGNNKK